MFLGHFAVALAARRAAPRASLGTMVVAAQLLDLAWPLLLLLGIERAEIDPGNTAVTPLDFVSYPYTHSLLMVSLWAVLFGGAWYLLRHNARGAIVLGALVLSHWVLDFITHRPDLPLLPGSDLKAGLGAWNSWPLTLVLEFGFLAAGTWLYVTATRARDRVGSVAFWAFVGVLVGIYAANVNSPPPPAIGVVAVAGLLLWLFVPWAAWFDRHRDPA